MSVVIKQLYSEDVECAISSLRTFEKTILSCIGNNPESTVRRAAELSMGYSWSFRVDGELVAIFGVVPVGIITGYGLPWVIPTQAIEHHKKQFYKSSKCVIKELRKFFPHMISAVDSRHEASLRWVRRLGFCVKEYQENLNVKFQQIELREI